MTPIVRLACATLGLVGAAGLLGAGPDAAAQIEDGGEYALSARADVASLEVRAPDANLVIGEQVIYGSPATAQAVLDSLGSSRAFASAPYFGDVVTTLPGTINGFSAGSLPPVPSYPLVVNSDKDTTPSAEAAYGPYALEAASDADRSSATSAIGSSFVAAAEVSRGAEAGTLVAEAAATFRGLSIEGALDIGEVRSWARLTTSVEGTPQLETETFGGLRVLDVPLGLGPDGLVAGDTIVPVDVGSLLAQLHEATGIELRVVPSASNEDGTEVRSAALQLVLPGDVPGLGRVDNILTVGQVVVTASARALPGFGDLGSGGLLPEAGAGAGVDAVGASIAPLPSPVAAVPGSGSVPRAGSPTTPAASASQSREPLLLDVESLYAVLAGAALASVGGSRLIGRLSTR